MAFLFIDSIALANAVAMKIGDQPSDGTNDYHLYLAANLEASSMIACQDVALADCKVSSNNIQTQLIHTTTDRKVFKTLAPVTMRDAKTISIVALSSSGQVIASARVSIKKSSDSDGGGVVVNGSKIKMQDITFTVPQGWKVRQDAYHEGTLILGITDGSQFLRVYVERGSSKTLQSRLINNSAQVVSQPQTKQLGIAQWSIMQSRKGQMQTAGFQTEKNGYVYWGFVTGTSASSAVLESFLQATL
jgi:hypothetical protein